jgi:hypothetical protein
MRGEFQNIQTAFALLPSALTANKVWVNNGTGTAATLTAGSLSMAYDVTFGGTFTTGGAFTMSGAYAFTGTLTGATTVTYPTTGTLATLAGNENLTNKTLTSPAIAGTPTFAGITNGQVLIGSTSGNTLAAANLTPGTGITITNAAGAITIATTVSTATANIFTALNYGGF